ncbi:hypothetical protein C3Y87_12510 [Carbonactinospora thermoautotrophica]|uniref:hypothetical protein n=1 Tax=Carbonactinospora thermoautotrophica TaxID=1469144 RepID=UPI0022709A5F|nr:hypothetical protein [Carbonactinospora thermoautotrophica]MCX9192221.1 hypothetical protein [Carbonactinospora thermoautotrophica]
MTSEAQPLAPGVEVFDVPGRGLALRTPHGEFLDVTVPAEQVPPLLDHLRGGGSAPPPRLLDAFAEAGFLGRPATWPAARRRVLVTGDAVLVDPLVALLAAAGAEPAAVGLDAVRELGLAAGAGPHPAAAKADRAGGPDPAVRADGVAAVVWCCDGPAPRDWRLFEDALVERGIAWQRCSREGYQMYIEPVAAQPGDVLHEHVRLRRLATCVAHRHLAAYWTGERIAGPHRLLGPAEAALVASLLVADLRAWALGTYRGSRPAWVPGTRDRSGATLPPARRVRRVDLRDLTVTEHPVLPIPPVEPNR